MNHLEDVMTRKERSVPFPKDIYRRKKVSSVEKDDQMIDSHMGILRRQIPT
jgi:hypothetical protein